MTDPTNVHFLEHTCKSKHSCPSTISHFWSGSCIKVPSYNLSDHILIVILTPLLPMGLHCLESGAWWDRFAWTVRVSPSIKISRSPFLECSGNRSANDEVRGFSTGDVSIEGAVVSRLSFLSAIQSSRIEVSDFFSVQFNAVCKWVRAVLWPVAFLWSNKNWCQEQ
jgi:hypothetical protein